MIHHFSPSNLKLRTDFPQLSLCFTFSNRSYLNESYMFPENLLQHKMSGPYIKLCLCYSLQVIKWPLMARCPLKSAKFGTKLISGTDTTIWTFKYHDPVFPYTGCGIKNSPIVEANKPESGRSLCRNVESGLKKQYIFIIKEISHRWQKFYKK
jgi:hypothetical protein